MILVSPAEPKAIAQHFEISSMPEQYGADFLWTTPSGLVGCQRKEVSDLVASVHGDRIARELGQSEQLERMVLIVEGSWYWDREDVSQSTGISRAQYDGLMLSFQYHGWWTLTTVDVSDTVRTIKRTEKWFQKEEHNSLVQRPKSRAPWGTAKNRSWGVHVLQGFDGIGVGTCGNIYDHFGTVPLRWTITEKELMKVKGIGKGRAKALMEALGGEEKE